VPRKRQIGTRIDDSGEIAEAWDEYKEDYENKSSAMRQLMRQGLGIDESDRQDSENKSASTPRNEVLQSLYIGSFVTLLAWACTTAGALTGLLDVQTGSLVVSGIIVLGVSSTVLHLRFASEQKA
jgi:hypothetical protein